MSVSWWGQALSFKTDMSINVALHPKTLDSLPCQLKELRQSGENSLMPVAVMNLPYGDGPEGSPDPPEVACAPAGKPAGVIWGRGCVSAEGGA